MLKPLTREQEKLIKAKKIADEQAMLAQQGVSSAIENGQVVTIGNGDCDYWDFKHFVVAQIARMGFDNYEDITGWDHDELIFDLSDYGPEDVLWREDVMGYFDGVEGKS